MSLILALDSSTDACSVSLNNNGKITSLFELASKSHTQRLLPMIDELLASEAISLQDLDALAFGRGPGSFTGLRICIGVVQGLAYGANLPVIPVSTLEAMALQHYRVNQQLDLPVVATLDARMDEIYWAAYQFNAPDSLLALTSEVVAKPASLLNELSVHAISDFCALGSGWHYPALNEVAHSGRYDDLCPRAEEMALIAARQFAEGKSVAITEAQPVYLRDTISWQKRTRIRTS